MPNITTSIHEPPIYRAGLSAGTDIGPRMALDALTGEHVNQDSFIAAHPDFGSPVPALHAYTAACLLAVTKLGRCQVPASADPQGSRSGPSVDEPRFEVREAEDRIQSAVVLERDAVQGWGDLVDVAPVQANGEQRRKIVWGVAQEAHRLPWERRWDRHLRQITHVHGEATLPDWSPDGGRWGRWCKSGSRCPCPPGRRSTVPGREHDARRRRQHCAGNHSHTHHDRHWPEPAHDSSSSGTPSDGHGAIRRSGLCARPSGSPRGHQGRLRTPRTR
jgi:hypothetical protein